MCPACQAPFVAPPQPVIPIGYDHLPQKRKWGLYIAATISAIAILATLPLLTSRMQVPQTNISGIHLNSLALQSAPKTPAPTISKPEVSVPESNGIFKIERQRDRAPVIAIRNDTSFPLRFQTWDRSGRNFIQWIDSFKTAEFNLPEGYYRAYVDSPYDQMTLPADGEVDIRDFHHYQADFIYGSAREPARFYIGD